MSINYNDKKFNDWLKEENRKLAELIPRWHPYPEEKPAEEYGYYLVTVAGREVHEAIWSDGFYWDDDYNGSWIDDVIAWAEMPRPYKG